MCDVLIIGAGLFGLTVAERLATAGRSVGAGLSVSRRLVER